MSIELINEFIELANNDKDLQKELATCQTMEELLLIVKGRGYDFSKEDLDSLVNGRILGDNKLDAVCGGANDGSKEGATWPMPKFRF